MSLEASTIWLLTPLSENLGVPRYILALAIFVAASLTDYFDGKIARRRKQVSKLGKLLDPIADKLLISISALDRVSRVSARRQSPTRMPH